jgi:hypothetical protein
VGKINTFQSLNPIPFETKVILNKHKGKLAWKKKENET